MNLPIKRGVHAAVIISSSAASLVIDPGYFGYPDEVDTADAALVTHDHFDHVDVTKLEQSLAKNPALRVYTQVALSLQECRERMTVVAEGERFTVGDIPVTVIGELQAQAGLKDEPIANVGYMVAGQILHPGDARQETENVALMLVALTVPWQNHLQMEEYL